MAEISQPPPSAELLRQELVVKLRRLNAVRTEPIENAILTVPRHAFVPEVTLEQAYHPEHAVVTKRGGDGVALSAVSAARIQAFMLEQAEIRPGMRVLEIGSGGYNAALIAELVGEAGEVTTVDIDPDVTSRASRLLREAGYERVNVVLADGEHGEPSHAPYDRIVVTADAADISPAWVGQLASGGRLVVPLRVRGLTRSIAFEAESGYLADCGYELCGFVPMQGAGEHRERLVVLHDDADKQVALRLDVGQQADVGLLRAALGEPGEDAWSGLTAGPGTPYDDLDLWLATFLPGYALLAATRQARDAGLVASWSPLGVSTLIDGGSFAYLQFRAVNAERTLFEFGARGHGPGAAGAAGKLVTEIQAWGARRGGRAAFRADPARTPDDQLPAGLTVDRKHYRITISWLR